MFLHWKNTCNLHFLWNAPISIKWCIDTQLVRWINKISHFWITHIPLNLSIQNLVKNSLQNFVLCWFRFSILYCIPEISFWYVHKFLTPLPLSKSLKIFLTDIQRFSNNRVFFVCVFHNDMINYLKEETWITNKNKRESYIFK